MVGVASALALLKSGVRLEGIGSLGENALLVLISGEFADDPRFDLAGMLAQQIALVSDDRGIDFAAGCARFDELYRESGEVGFMFKRAA